MRRILIGVLALAVALLAGGCGHDAHVPSPETLVEASAQTRRSSRDYAGGYVEHEDGCLRTTTWFYVVDQVWHEGRQAPTGQGWAGVSVYAEDTCTGTVLADVSGGGPLMPGAFSVTGSLERARLRAQYEAFDEMREETVVLAVDVTWRGVGEVHETKLRTRDEDDGITHVFRGDGLEREAVLVADLTIGDRADRYPAARYRVAGPGWLSRHRHSSTYVDPKGPPVAPEIEWFYASPPRIWPGESVMLTWLVTGTEPITLVIEPGVGDVSEYGGIGVRPDATTTYTLTATNARGSASAQVTVAIVEPDPADPLEPNDTCPKAASIPATFESPLLGLVPGDVDWFVFEVTEATAFFARVASWDHDEPYLEDPIDTRLLLFGACGARLDAFYGSWHTDPVLRAILPAGTYRLAVTALDDTDATGDHMRMGHYYLFTVAEPAPPSDAYEPNDTPQAAHPIALDFAADDLTFIPRDVDWFSFTLAEPRVVTANAVVTRYGEFMFDAILALLDADLERIDVRWQRVGAYLEAGAYYLGVAPQGDWDMTGAHWCTGEYHLEVVATEPPGPDAAEPNDDMDDAAELVLGSRTPVLSLVPGDVDWFRFSLSSWHTIELEMYPRDIGAGVGLLMWLLDGGGEALRLADEWSPFINEALDAGTYYVVVTGSPDWDRIGDHRQAFLYAIELLGYPDE